MWEVLTFAREQPYESSSDEKVIANLSSLYSAGNAVMVSTLNLYTIFVFVFPYYYCDNFILETFLNQSISCFRSYLHHSNAPGRLET